VLKEGLARFGQQQFARQARRGQPRGMLNEMPST
jgi:hypothetical protein